jgi:hypothetical protein
LSEEQQDHLWGEIADVMRDAVVGEAGSGDDSWLEALVIERRKEFTDEYRMVLVRHRSEVIGVVGYRISDLRNRKCLEMNNGYFRREYQGCGLGFLVSARLLFELICAHPFSEYFLLMQVHNPIVVAGWRARLPSDRMMYPSLSGAEPTSLLRDAAAEYASRVATHRAIDSDTGVIPGMTRPRTPSRVSCRDCVVSDYFAKHVDSTKGDSLLVIVDISRLALLRAGKELASAFRRSVMSSVHHRRSGMGGNG